MTLSTRIEQAGEGDRALDAEVHYAITNGIGCGGYSNAPHYTTSLDAAMTLVPDGMRWCVDTCDGKPRSFVEPRHPYEGQPFWGNAATPALAICAAALRARGL